MLSLLINQGALITRATARDSRANCARSCQNSSTRATASGARQLAARCVALPLEELRQPVNFTKGRSSRDPSEPSMAYYTCYVEDGL